MSNKTLDELIETISNDDDDSMEVQSFALPEGADPEALKGMIGDAIQKIIGNANRARTMTASDMPKLMSHARQYVSDRDIHPFSVGDIVMPREGFNLSTEGLPCVVVEVIEPRVLFDQTDKIPWASSGFGPSINTRIMHMDKGVSHCFWIESNCYRKMSDKEIADWVAKNPDPA